MTSSVNLKQEVFREIDKFPDAQLSLGLGSLFILVNSLMRRLSLSLFPMGLGG
jgi:hypothetical protein